ncbi:MAG: hypothetical protein JSW27_09635, partial [Phycisphaerales bacterium]
EEACGIAEGEAMSPYIRRYAAGGTFFFTVVTHNGHPLLASSEALLGAQNSRRSRFQATCP